MIRVLKRLKGEVRDKPVERRKRVYNCVEQMCWH